MKKLLLLIITIQLALLLVACSEGNANAVYSDVDDRVGESADSGFKEQISTDSTDKSEEPLREPYSDRIDYDDGSYKIYDYDADGTLLHETGYFSSGTISFANDYDKMEIVYVKQSTKVTEL